MKRFKLFILALLIAAFGFAVPVQAEIQDMWAAVYKWEGGMSADGKPVLTQLTSGVQFVVLSHASDTEETLYYPASKANISLTNPVTTTSFESTAVCNDRVAFRVDPTEDNDAAVDVIVTDVSGGFTAVVSGFNKYTHTIVIDERPNVMHHGITWFGHADSATAVDTGIDFLPKTMIHDVRVEVITVDADITLDVGTYDTAAGFRDGVSTATAGFVADTGVITNGTSAGDYTAVSTYGTLLYTAITGADVVAIALGGRSYLGHVVNTAGTDDDLYYTLLVAGNTAHGYIHYFFTKLR